MIEGAVLNGCVIAYSYDRLSKKCRACMYKDYCDEKSKEKQGVLAAPVIVQTKNDFSESLSMAGTAGVSAAEAVEALSKAMCLLGTNIHT